MRQRATVSLLVAALFVLSGCVGTGGPPATDVSSGTPTEGTTTGETTSAKPSDRGHYRAYKFESTAVTEADIARDVTLSRSDLEGRVTWGTDSFAATLFSEGVAEQIYIDGRDASSVGSLDEETVLRSNGTYYAVNKSVVTRHEGTAYGVELKGPLRPEFHDNYERAEQKAVNFSSLSAADRSVFEYALPPADERESAVTSAGYEYVFAPSVDVEDASLVDGDVHYVRYEGDIFRIASDGPRGTKVRYRVRYELRPVANSSKAFIENRLPTLVTPLNESNATDTTRSVLVDTVRGNPVEWEGRSEAPARISDAATWVDERPPGGSTAYVRYAGETYRVRVSKIVE